jgi:hypothetical protein
LWVPWGNENVEIPVNMIILFCCCFWFGVSLMVGLRMLCILWIHVNYRSLKYKDCIVTRMSSFKINCSPYLAPDFSTIILYVWRISFCVTIDIFELIRFL